MMSASDMDADLAALCGALKDMMSNANDPKDVVSGMTEMLNQAGLGNPVITSASARCTPVLVEKYGAGFSKDVMDALCDIMVDPDTDEYTPRSEELLALPEAELDAYIMDIAARLHHLRQQYDADRAALVERERHACSSAEPAA